MFCFFPQPAHLKKGLTSFWSDLEEVNISLRLPLGFVLCCMNFARQQEIGHKCHRVHCAVSSAEKVCRHLGSVRQPLNKRSNCLFRQWLCFSPFFSPSFFDKSDSHSASAGQDGFWTHQPRGQTEGSVKTTFSFWKKEVWHFIGRV